MPAVPWPWSGPADAEPGEAVRHRGSAPVRRERDETSTSSATASGTGRPSSARPRPVRPFDCERGTEDPVPPKPRGRMVDWNGGTTMHTKTALCVLDGLGQSVASVIFGVDGVIVDSARASAAAWKWVFDPILRSYAATHATAYTPFDVRADYLRYLLGRSLLEGVRGLLASRGVLLPYDDLRALAARHEEFFLGEVRRHGVSTFAATIVLVRELRRLGAHTAAVSEQCCGSELLRRAGVAGMFDVLLDGLDAPGTVLPAH